MPEVIKPGTLLQNQRYAVIEQISEGGMGSIYLAEDRAMRRRVAVKVTRIGTPEARTQFQREAVYLQKLHHHGLPRFWDYFSDTGQDFLVMEYIPGEDLNVVVNRSGRQPEWLVLRWADELLDTLDYLHRQSPPIIHRDVKPSNLKIRVDDSLVLVDFGIAKEFASGEATIAGAAAISPGYSPLEQYALGRFTDARSDIYSAGATLYFLLTGLTPSAATDLVTGDAHLAPPAQIAPELSSRTARLVMRALKLRRDERWSSASEMRQEVMAALRLFDSDSEDTTDRSVLTASHAGGVATELLSPPEHEWPGTGSVPPDRPVRSSKCSRAMYRLKSILETQRVLGSFGEFKLTSPSAAGKALHIAAGQDGLVYVAWDQGLVQGWRLPQGEQIFSEMMFDLVDIDSSSRAVLDIAVDLTPGGQTGCHALVLNGNQPHLVEVCSIGDLRRTNIGFGPNTLRIAHCLNRMYWVESDPENGVGLHSSDNKSAKIPRCTTPLQLCGSLSDLYVLGNRPKEIDWEVYLGQIPGVPQQIKHEYCLWRISENLHAIQELRCWDGHKDIRATWCPYDESIAVLVNDSSGSRLELLHPAHEQHVVLSLTTTKLRTACSVTATENYLFALDASTSTVSWYGYYWLRKHARIEREPLRH